MTELELPWKGHDGLSMHGQAWLPDGPPRGLVVLVHGFDEHAGRYPHVARALTAAGLAVYAHDVRGHGRSGGPAVYAERYELLMDDLAAFLALATARHPGLPRLLYGHSMGGGQVLNFLLRRRPDVAGAVATSPWLELAKAPPGWQLAAARVASVLAGGVALPTGLDAAGISRDPEVVRAYLADPFVKGKITPRLLVTVHAAGQWALAHAGQLAAPLLLLHGDADAITSFDASRRFAAATPPGLTTFRAWPGGFHELHNEPDRAEVLEVITGWLSARLAPGAGAAEAPR